jgi:hypothetical protein
MISVGAKGGTVINYSHRFSMSDMKGTFPSTVISGLKTVTGTDGPPTLNNINNAAAAAQSTNNAAQQDMYSVPFADQSGPLRYASMQRVPGTKITKKSRERLNPTSSYVLATTFLPPVMGIERTATMYGTWSYSQAENTGTPAAMPYDDVQRFLNRWRD